MATWDIDRMTRLRTTLEDLRKSRTPEWRWEDLVVYLRHYKRRQPETISSRLRQLRFMERHAAMPVHVHGSRDELVNSFCAYVTYRETVEGAPASTLVNDHRAVRVLGDFLAIPREVWPTAPTPLVEPRTMPSPEQVRLLLHTDYLPNVKRNPVNALVRYLLAFDFGFGPRFPSEAHALDLHDFDPARHLLTVTEPKKSGRRRQLLIEPSWLCCSTRHMSLANWLHWRAKLEPRTEAFFPRPDGGPWTSKYALNRFLRKHVVPRHPWFNPYLGRHWSVNARLVEWGHDYARVAAWHGHEHVDMTKNAYEHSARLHEALYGPGWLLRAFQRLPAGRRTAQGLVPGVSVHAASEGQDGLSRACRPHPRCRAPVGSRKRRHRWRQPSSTSPFFACRPSLTPRASRPRLRRRRAHARTARACPRDSAGEQGVTTRIL